MTPEISVIVPVYNRARQVERCVAGLMAQDLGPSLYEIVVVDDGSTDDPGENLRPWLADARMTLVRLAERVGRGPARNAALAVAGGRYVAFVDSDAYAPPWFLRAHLAAHARVPECIVDGPAITVESVGPEAVHANRVRVLAWLDRGGEQFVTVNTSCSRLAIEQAGGFDARFGLRYGWEDVELGDRLRALGLSRVKERRAYVVHERERTSLLERGRKLEECGANAAIYYAKAPTRQAARRIRPGAIRQARVCDFLGLTENRLARPIAAPLYLIHRYAAGLRAGMAESGPTTAGRPESESR